MEWNGMGWNSLGFERMGNLLSFTEAFLLTSFMKVNSRYGQSIDSIEDFEHILYHHGDSVMIAYTDVCIHRDSVHPHRRSHLY